MALINCPECGQKISDTTPHCIHCGVKINICPECKSVSIGDTTFCSVCGYTFSKPTAQSAPPSQKNIHPQQSLANNQSSTSTSTPTKQAVNVQQIYDDWSTGKNFPDILLKRWIYWLFIGFGGLFFILAITKAFPYWKENASLDRTDQALRALIYKSSLKDINSLLWAGTIFELLGLLTLQAQELYLHLSISRWLTTYDKEYNSVIAKTLATKSDLYIGKAETLAIASWLTQHPDKKSMRIRTSIVSSLLSVVGSIIGNIFLINLIDQATLLSLEQIKSLNIGNNLFFLLVAIAIPSIIVSILESKYKKTGKAWLKQYYSQN